jgi:hypothetical protein
MVPLVGREHELATLTSAFEDLAVGTGRLFLFVGEAGMGKTRLAEEVAQRASKRGLRVAWGRAWEGGVTPAFWPWTQILRALAGSSPAPLLTSSPELPIERFELFDAVARFLAETTNEHAAVIILEDLHAADRATVALLGFLATQLRGTRVLLVVTYREAELQRLNDSEIEVLRAARLGHTMPLGPLPPADVFALARALGVHDDVAERVYRATDGHPFFACEAFRALRARPSDGVPIPTSVRAFIRERMATLDPVARSLVEVAGAFGRDFAPSVIAELTEMSVDVALAQASTAGLIEQTDGRFRFVHALVRDVVYEETPPSRRTELHVSIAKALERHGAPELVAIAHHYLSAGPSTVKEAVRAACAAADRCTRDLAYEDAIAIAERALAVVEATVPGELALHAELLICAGTARLRAGNDVVGRRTCDTAAAYARRIGSPELLARAALAYGSVLRPAGVDPLLVGMLEEALLRLPDGRVRSLVEARLAGALQPAFDPLVPIARAKSAIASARGLDPATRLAVLLSAGAAMQDVGDARERLEVDRETLGLALAHGDLAIALRARQRLVFDYISLGDPTSADRELDVLDTEAAGLPARLRWSIQLERAMRALCQARFDDAARHVATARALLDHGVVGPIDRCFKLRATFEALLRDQADALAARWAEAAPAFHQRPVAELCGALVHARGGRVDEARASLRSASREAVIAFAADPPTSLLLAEVIDAIGDASLAAEVAPRVEPIAGRIAVWSWLAMTCLGPTERALALLARARGRLDEAARWFAEAEGRAERGGLVLHLPRIQYERGVTLLTAGDSSLGFSCLERAAAGCERIGLPELAARVATARAETVSPSHAAAVELRRDGELWLITGAGESHRLKDSRGMQLLAKLLELPEREVHVLDLATDSNGPIDVGDAGESIDARARDAYRRRASELRAEIDDADAAHDLGRADRARRELEHIEAELVSSVGLGGRGRRVANATERARINAQRRIADAVRRIHQVSPALGDHLERCVRTGTHCRYSPANPRG